MKKFFSKMKYVKLKHFVGLIPFVIAVIPALFYKKYLKIKNKQVWLISEQHNTARDNGYYFFKYINKKHNEIENYYVIDYDCDDYYKVKQIGKTIKYGSLKHYFYYMSCTYNISSHKESNPNEMLFTILHLYLNLFNNRIFLQHGIIKDNLPMFYEENTKFKLFICGAKPEYEYIKNNYHYKNNEVVYTGLARFDSLCDLNIPKIKIALIPTWRRWLGVEINGLNKQSNFLNSEYFKFWNSIINNEKLIKLLETKNIELIFYPHVMMQPYINFFETKSSSIKIIKREEKDIQELMKECKLLITDYSSVFFDFAYMNKPIIYYQFDYEEYRKKHMEEGYFDYKINGFGPVCENENKLLQEITNVINNNFELENQYKKRINEFFERKDQNNCERIFNSILNIGK
mgnify:CR=1 FL=1